MNRSLRLWIGSMVAVITAVLSLVLAVAMDGWYRLAWGGNALAWLWVAWWCYRFARLRD